MTDRETQKQRAQSIIEEMDHHAIQITQCHESLTELLGRAQNDPPHGESDRSISPAEFTRLREIENAMTRLRRALGNVWSPGEAKTLDPDDWQAP